MKILITEKQINYIVENKIKIDEQFDFPQVGSRYDKPIQRDVLDPSKVNPDYTKNQISAQFYKKYGRMPTPEDFQTLDTNMSFNDMVDWIVWALKWMGPQGQLAARIGEAAQGLVFFIQAYKTSDLFGQVSNFVNGLSKLLSVANVNLKIPGLDSTIKKITDFLKRGSFQNIIQKLITKGIAINQNFDKQSKLTQAIITLLAEIFGEGIIITLKWIVNNLMTPLYELIKTYNPTIAKYIDNFIRYLNVFMGMIKTAKIIIDDPDTKGILNLKLQN